jgi:hypothetical protein
MFLIGSMKRQSYTKRRWKGMRSLQSLFTSNEKDPMISNIGTLEAMILVTNNTSPVTQSKLALY